MHFALPACAWRSDAGEHYFGPVLYRTAFDAKSRTEVAEVVHVGLLGEAGRQVGLSLGVVRRLAASSTTEAGVDAASASTVIDAPHWAFSPFYVKLTRTGRPRFVRRAIYGMQAAFGAEVRALSAGVVTRTLFEPPPDAISSLRFEADSPMQTRLRIWSVPPGTPLPDSTVTDVMAEQEAP